MSDAAFAILSVPDLPATRAFYESLGFTQSYQFPPEGEPGFVTLERDGATIGIAAGAEGGDSFAYWAYVDDVDATYERLLAAGAPGVAQPTDQPWGERVASVRDPAGNLVHVGAPAAPPDR